MPLLYVLMLITSLECPGFTQAIVQFDKSIFTLDVNPLSGDQPPIYDHIATTITQLGKYIDIKVHVQYNNYNL